MTWPITDPSYGTYQWLQLGIGHFLGHGFNSDSWDEEQKNYVDYILERGVWQFYNPPPTATPHTWSFLKLKASITLLNNDVDYDLPSDYGGGFCNATYEDGDTTRRVQFVSEHHVRSLHSFNQQDGAPTIIAVRPKAIGLTAEQAFEAIVYPRPTTATIPTSTKIDYFYRTNHAALSTTNLYPLGTRSHSETIMTSCLAIAEQCESKGSSNAMQGHFLERLNASVAIDKFDSADGDSVQTITDMARQSK